MIATTAAVLLTPIVVGLTQNEVSPCSIYLPVSLFSVSTYDQNVNINPRQIAELI